MSKYLMSIRKQSIQHVRCQLMHIQTLFLTDLLITDAGCIYSDIQSMTFMFGNQELRSFLTDID